MNLLLTLLAKDFRRILRNPVPMVILLGIPIAISALIGFAFAGGGGDNPQIAPIRLGLLDEDQSLFSQFLRGATGQEDFSERIELTILEEETQGVELIQKGKLSAILIIPEGFTEAFVNGEDGIKLRLIKNPSESIYPTLAQEGADVIVTALNSLVRNFQKDLQELHGLLEEDREFDLFRDILAVSTLVERAQNRLDAAAVYLNPPLVTYREETEEINVEATGADADEEPEPESSFNLFAYLLIGMAAMFMLMIADNCMRDLYKESRFRTLERFRTMREELWQFVAVKVIYTVIVLMLTVVILLGGGSLIFGFGWQQYGPTIALAFCYSCFGAGFMGLISALAGKERRADMLNTMIVIILAACGGAMWPVEGLPPFVRNYLTPISPPYWFSDQVRKLQIDPLEANWLPYCALLLGLGVVMIAGSASIFRIRLEKGIKE